MIHSFKQFHFDTFYCTNIIIQDSFWHSNIRLYFYHRIYRFVSIFLSELSYLLIHILIVSLVYLFLSLILRSLSTKTD